MSNAHRLGFAILKVHEGTDIVEFLERGIHTIEPYSSRLACAGCAGQHKRSRAEQ
jgi:hypothetical protein